MTSTDARRPLPPAAIVPFLLAGHATFSLRNTLSGNHQTFRLTQLDNPRTSPVLFLLARLVAPDVWLPAGKLAGHRVAADALTFSVKGNGGYTGAFPAVWERLHAGRQLPPTVEVWHEGACGRCKRPLTDPTSIERGLGPICAAQADDDNL